MLSLVALVLVLPLLSISAQSRVELRKRAQAPITPPTPQFCTWNSVNWRTNYASLQADGFFIQAGGQEFYANNSTMRITSDPGDSAYTTLETVWFENDREMRLFIYFKSNGSIWKPFEIRTYDGNIRGEWIYYNTDKLGVASLGSSIYFNSPLVLEGLGGQTGTATGYIFFKNLRLNAFPRVVTPTPPVCTPVTFSESRAGGTTIIKIAGAWWLSVKSDPIWNYVSYDETNRIIYLYFNASSGTVYIYSASYNGAPLCQTYHFGTGPTPTQRVTPTFTPTPRPTTIPTIRPTNTPTPKPTSAPVVTCPGVCCRGDYGSCNTRLISPFNSDGTVNDSGGCNPTKAYPGTWCCRSCR